LFAKFSVTGVAVMYLYIVLYSVLYFVTLISVKRANFIMFCNIPYLTPNIYKSERLIQRIHTLQLKMRRLYDICEYDGKVENILSMEISQ